MISCCTIVLVLSSFAVETADLYGNRLLLGTGGSPRVAVGLHTEQNQVVLSAPSGLDVVGQRQGESKASQISLGGRLVLQHLSGKPALLRHAVAVATLEGAERSQRDQVLAKWRLLGEKPRPYEVGLVFGIGGSVVDNRTTVIAVRPSSSLARTKQVAATLHREKGATTRVISKVLKLPSMVVQASGAQGNVTFEGTVVFRDRSGGPVTVAVANGQQRSYLGSIALAPDSNGQIAVVNITEIDNILQGVVPAEMFATAHIEALKAQAVTARGAVFAKLGLRHFAEPFNLCNNEHCQVYQGVHAHHKKSSLAVTQTLGELSFLGGHLVDSVYSSTCGGHTENAEVVWDTPPKAALRGRRDVAAAGEQLARGVVPFEHGGLGVAERLPLGSLSQESELRRFLASPPDSYCAKASMVRQSKLRWSKRLTSAEMDRLMFRYGVGHVTSIEILGRGVSGRVRAVRVVGERAETVVQREWPVRKAFAKLNSGAFVIDRETGPDGKLVAFVFRGAGWGHGVGMCQVGAIGMAEAGATYLDILRHYYNGAQVKKVY